LLNKSFTDISGTDAQKEEFNNYKQDPIAGGDALVEHY
jgi:hypothetical protein